MGRHFSSDEHFDHHNIIGYCSRPFPTVEEMNFEMVERWNSTVAPGDEVWCLGDASLGKGLSGLAYIGLLNGYKILVPGNHDKVACYHKGAQAARALYLAAGFDEIVDGPVSLEIAGRRVLVDHFPYLGDSHGRDRYVQQRPVDRGGWLLHGHVHDLWRQRDRMINVGVDAWGGRPVSEDELAALITAGPADLEPLSW